MFCIHQILQDKQEFNEAVQQLFIDFKKAYDSVRMEVFYNNLFDFGILMKLVRLIKYVWMKSVAEAAQASICLTCFLLEMV